MLDNSIIFFNAHRAECSSYIHITVIPYLPRLVVAEDYERELTPPFGRGIFLIWENFTACVHLCSTYLMKEVAPV